MPEKAKMFKDRSKEIAFDRNHRNIINHNISKYEEQVKKGLQIFKELNIARQRAANIKYNVLSNLEKYLIEFENNFTERGGKVIWATDEKEAIHEILQILKKHNADNIVKSKSMTTEEINLNEHLEKNGYVVKETDLGEFIVQTAGEKPYHIVTPAMHKSKQDVAELFTKNFGLPENSSPKEITRFVRKSLKKDFTTAKVGITGANFLIANTGAVAITENEGNAILSSSMPRVHIVISGIEKIIHRQKDLSLFWPLLANHGTGQEVTNYNSIFAGPKSKAENDGPEEMIVILLDNNRTELLKQIKQRRALSCIRCGACLNFCPVYKNIGGYTYDATYSGPIGSVITPFLENKKEYKHLSDASTLCGRCSEVCPVNIPIHQLLLENRNHFVIKKHINKKEKKAIKLWKYNVLKRKRLDRFGMKTKTFFFNKFFENSWGKNRVVPKFAEKSFSKQWKEMQKKR